MGCAPVHFIAATLSANAGQASPRLFPTAQVPVSSQWIASAPKPTPAPNKAAQANTPNAVFKAFRTSLICFPLAASLEGVLFQLSERHLPFLVARAGGEGGIRTHGTVT